MLNYYCMYTFYQHKCKKFDIYLRFHIRHPQFYIKKNILNNKSLIISKTHKDAICIERFYKTLRKLDVGPNLKSKFGVIFNLNLKVNK